MNVVIKGLAIAALLTLGLAAAQPPAPAQNAAALHAKAPRRLVIKNAMVIYGNAKPPYGPVDIVFLDGPAEGLRELVWEMQPTAVVIRGAIETPEQRVPSGRRPLRRNFIRNCMATCSLRQDRPESISRRTCAASPAASTRNHAVPSRRTRQGRATQMFEDCRWDPILSESAQLRAAGFRHVIL